jgi:hypothetical protein
MIAESLNQKECLNCKSDLAALGKNRQALYCGVQCKNAYRRIKDPEIHTLQTAKYKSTMRGRAIAMFHGTKVGRRFRDGNELTPEWIMQKLQHGFCEVTNLPFTYGLEARNPWSPSLDRIDPKIGYTLENTRVVVWVYNTAKNVFHDEDVMLMAQALINQGIKETMK